MNKYLMRLLLAMRWTCTVVDDGRNERWERDGEVRVMPAVIEPGDVTAHNAAIAGLLDDGRLFSNVGLGYRFALLELADDVLDRVAAIESLPADWRLPGDVVALRELRDVAEAAIVRAGVTLAAWTATRPQKVGA